jgi:hypothetical protein
MAYFALGVISFVASYYAGASIGLAEEDANQIATQFAEETADIGTLGLYSNNLLVALGMFVPGFGAAFGVYTGASTGLLLNALVATYDLQGVTPLGALANPFAILEILAYGLAMSRSGLLVYQLVKKKSWREYAVPTAVEIGIVVVILLIAAIVEGQVIA